MSGSAKTGNGITGIGPHSKVAVSIVFFFYINKKNGEQQQKKQSETIATIFLLDLALKGTSPWADCFSLRASCRGHVEAWRQGAHRHAWRDDGSILAQANFFAWAEFPAQSPLEPWRPFAWLIQTWWRLVLPLESHAKSSVLRLLSACSVQAVGLGNTSLPKDPPCSPMQVTTCRISSRSSPSQRGQHAQREPRTASQQDAVTSSATTASPRSQGRHDA